MESFLQSLSSLDPLGVYLVVGGIAFIENIFPPFPSDVVVVAAGSLIALGRVETVPLLVASSVGSATGFVVMYYIGAWIGGHILETGRIKFIPRDRVQKVEAWFARYGYGIVVANRFLAGTRAVVSFFAGMSHLSIGRCILLSLLSAVAWNAILIEAGRGLGANWQEILVLLEVYARSVTAAIIVIAAAYVAYRLYRKRRKASSTSGEPRP